MHEESSHVYGRRREGASEITVEKALFNWEAMYYTHYPFELLNISILNSII